MSFKKGYRAGLNFWDKVADFITAVISKPKSRNLSLSANKRELKKLYNETADTYENSVFPDLDQSDLTVDLLIDVFLKAKMKPTEDIIQPFYDTVFYLLNEDGLLGPEEINFYSDYSFSEQIEIRKYLRRFKRKYSLDQEYLEAWIQTLTNLFIAILHFLPKQVRFESDEKNTFSIDLVHFLENPADCVECILSVFFDEYLDKIGLLSKLSETLYLNTLKVSGIELTDPPGSKRLVHPQETNLQPTELVHKYLKNTPFEYILTQPYNFSIPLESRLEHCHIVGGTGHGKTQLIQSLILEDLNSDDQPGICTIDSQGDLINKITLLERFDPDTEDSLADKLIIIDPTDIDYPVCLNMFALNERDVDGLSNVNKEMLLNATVDLYSYMFGALFGAELTMRQGVIFNYIARLMMEIPDATIQTLRELMDDGKKFIPYMEKLKGSSRAFFQTQFFSRSFAQTKKQVLSRLWGVLSNATLERMFSNSENRIDLYDAMNSGKIVLINTAKSLLGKEGSKILGRFFIALLGQAFLKRSAIPEKDRKPFFVYIDEAHEYFDERLDQQLNQARKYKVGFTLAHQNLEQLSTSLKATIMSSTSVKFAGGVSNLDANALAHETRTTKESILEVKKRENHTEFACWIKNITRGMVKLNVPFGLLEKEPVLSQSSFTKLIELNRKKFCVKSESIIIDDSSPFTIQPDNKKKTKTERKTETTSTKNDKSTPTEKPDSDYTQPKPKPPVVETSKTAKPEKNAPEEKEITTPSTPQSPEVPKTGKGGPQHRYIQNLVRRFAQERGYKATVEQSVFDGAGSVDVSLEGYGERIACEISVTTDSKWEMQNIAKCLAAGYGNIVVLASENKHLHKLRNSMSESFSKEIKDNKILFFLPDAFITYLDQKRAESAKEEKTVRGYNVKVKYSPVSAQDEELKKEAIAKVILQSMKKL